MLDYVIKGLLFLGIFICLKNSTYPDASWLWNLATGMCIGAFYRAQFPPPARKP